MTDGYTHVTIIIYLHKVTVDAYLETMPGYITMTMDHSSLCMMAN